jgi:hypothetical protein
MSTEYFVTIINESPIPINVETWKSVCFIFSEMKSITLKPGERKIMSSETGEWIINTYIFDKALCNQWIVAGYTPGKVIGKFRIDTAISGKNTWISDTEFKIIYFNGVVKISKIVV